MTVVETGSTKPAGSLSRAFWVEFPVWLTKFVPSVASSFTDGQHLLKWKPVAACTPFLAVIVGVLAEWFQASEIFSTSWIVIIGLASIGLLSVQLGAWTLVGYITADLVTGRRISSFGRSDLPEALDWTAFWVSAAVEYLLLIIAVVGVPMLVLNLRLAIRRHRLHETIGVVGERVVHVFAVAVGYWMWCQLVITSIRTVFTFGGWAEKKNAVFTAQEQWPIIVVALAVVAVTRFLIETVAHRDEAVDVVVETTLRMRERIRPPGPWWRRVPAQIIIGLLLLGGIIDWWWQAVITSFVYFFVAAARHLITDTRLGGWLTQFPILLRLGVAFGLGFAVITQIVSWLDGGGTLYNITPGRSFFFPWLAVNISLVFVGLATITNTPHNQPPPDNQPPAPPPGNQPPTPPDGFQTRLANIEPPGRPPTPHPPTSNQPPGQPPLPPPGFQTRIAALLTIVAGFILVPGPAAADNCSGLGDCFDTQTALWIALAILFLLLAAFLIWWAAPAIAATAATSAFTIGGTAALTGTQFAAAGTALAYTTGTAFAASGLYILGDQTGQAINDYNQSKHPDNATNRDTTQQPTTTISPKQNQHRLNRAMDGQPVDPNPKRRSPPKLKKSLNTDGRANTLKKFPKLLRSKKCKRSWRKQ